MGTEEQSHHITWDVVLRKKVAVKQTAGSVEGAFSATNGVSNSTSHAPLTGQLPQVSSQHVMTTLVADAENG